MSKHELPKFHETFIPILDLLSDSKVRHTNREMVYEVRDKYYSDLSDDLLREEISTGRNRLLDRIGWGASYLKMGKYVFVPQRGLIQITDKGLKTAKKKTFTFDDLKSDKDYIKHVENRQKKARHTPSPSVTNDNSTPGELVEAGISQIEAQVKNDLLEKLVIINPYEFEKLILRLLKKMGYGDFTETPKSGDGGIDGVINQDHLGLEKIFIQAKRYNEGLVRENDIRNFIGAMAGDASKGVFVTTSNFHEGAIKKAKEAHHTIVLINGSDLVDLMYNHGVGVQIETVYEIKSVDNDFFE